MCCAIVGAVNVMRQYEQSLMQCTRLVFREPKLTEEVCLLSRNKYIFTARVRELFFNQCRRRNVSLNGGSSRRKTNDLQMLTTNADNYYKQDGMMTNNSDDAFIVATNNM